MKKTNKKSFGVIAILSLVIAAVCSLTSCSDDLDVQQSYPFTVEVMPYADKIAKGQTVELRFEIKPEGNYANTLYTIRYFQYDGEGSLKLVDGPVLVNNDRVLLESKTFRLNYTAQSSEAVKFGIWIEDNFGSTPWQQTFEFNSKDSDDEGGKTPGIISPVNPGTITPIGL
ncbi:DUF3872 domain-containing protein [uncultured Duncaniella sp.]|uniref:DUF3872 domain-containing protein n=1 Tax=uncultured Duncaniella sp. TaxID=2768039 RepID=UPI0025A9365D|nr:DUF3872 domain-containing protein [uncultured Duncaniella sp.]